MIAATPTAAASSKLMFAGFFTTASRRCAGTPSRPTRSSSRIRGRATWRCRRSGRSPSQRNGRLREAGFSADLTYHAYHGLDSHILGFTLWQLGHGIVDDERIAGLAASFFRLYPGEYPYLYEHAQQHLTGFGRGERGAFELVLDLILDGIERERQSS